MEIESLRLPDGRKIWLGKKFIKEGVRDFPVRGGGLFRTEAGNYVIRPKKGRVVGLWTFEIKEGGKFRIEGIENCEIAVMGEMKIREGLRLMWILAEGGKEFMFRTEEEWEGVEVAARYHYGSGGGYCVLEEKKRGGEDEDLERYISLDCV